MSGPQEDGRLGAYLLGRLPEDEEEAIEREYFRGGEAYDRLLVAEDELIDAYAAGRLAADDARRFEEHFLSSPERRERVAFAQALRARAEREAARPAPRRPSPFLPLAATLPLALAAGWLFVSVRDLRTELARQREHQASVERESAERQSRIARLEEELSHAHAGGGVAAWRVQPGFERDASPPAVLTVPAGTDLVRLELALGPAARTGPVAARVETADGHLVAAFEGLRPREGNGRVLDVIVTAASLAPGTYVVILEAGSPREALDTYRLRVAAPR